jgi:hypothetical protein
LRPSRKSAFPWSFPPAVPWPGVPLPSTGSLGSVPPLRRYYGDAPTPHRPSRLASFPSLGGTVAAAIASLSQVAGRLAPASLDVWSAGRPTGVASHGGDGASQVPGWTLVRAPRSQTPGGSRRQAISAPRCRRANRNRAGSSACTFRGSISRHAHSLSTLRRTRSPAPTQDSLPAGGQPVPGRALTCWAHFGRFQVSLHCLPPSPGLTWRTTNSVSVPERIRTPRARTGAGLNGASNARATSPTRSSVRSGGATRVNARSCPPPDADAWSATSWSFTTSSRTRWRDRPR